MLHKFIELKSSYFYNQILLMAIYFDNAATTPLIPEVKEVMIDIIQNEYGNPSSIHMMGRVAKTIVERSRKTIANVVKSAVGEIFFTSGATESNNLILQKSVESLGIQRIISSPIEHHCVLHTLEFLQKKGCDIIYLNVSSEGNIDLDQLEQLLKGSDAKTLVSIMHGNNELGNITDIKTIGKLCREHGALFHTDTAQTVGKLDIDAHGYHIDFLTGSAHKFYGPKGIGFVFINGDHKLEPMLLGGSQERNMRSGTENVICIAGMAKALETSYVNMEAWQQDVTELKSLLKTGIIDSVPGIQVLGTQDQSLNHILSVSFPESAKSDLMEVNLDMAGVFVSAGSACSSGTLKASHVMEAIQADPSRKTVRFSFSHMNTIDEVNQVLQVLSK